MSSAWTKVETRHFGRLFGALLLGSLFLVPSLSPGLLQGVTAGPSPSVLVSLDEGQGWLGVWLADVTPRLQRRYGLSTRKGAFVVDVVDGSPADEAGLRKHDVVVAVNGHPVEDEEDLADYLEHTRPGEQITLEVLRNGKRRTLKVRLAERPRRLDNLFVPRPPKRPLPNIVFVTPVEVMLGVEVQDLNRDLARYFHLKKPRGVLITDVDEDGPAADAGLKAGDVIVEVDGVPIEDTDHLEEVLREDYEPGDEVDLTVVRDGKRKTFTVRLDGRQYGFWYGFGWPGRSSFLPKDWETQRELLQEQLEKLLRKQLKREQLDVQEELRRQIEKLRRELDDLKRELEDLKAELEKRKEAR